MTTREMIIKLWDLAGQAMDLYPFSGDVQTTDEIDINAQGTQYFLRLLSEGQVALANWKKKDGRFLRFKQFYISKNIQLGVDEDVTFDVTRTGANTYLIDPTQTGFVMDSSTLENSVMNFGSSYYKVMMVDELDANNWQFSLYPEIPESDDYDDTEDDDDDPTYPQTFEDVQFGINEFDVYNNGVSNYTYRLDLPERVYQILRIDDFEGNSEVRRTGRKDELLTAAESFNVGTPSEYQNFGSKLVFNTALLEKRWYRFELFQQPTSLTTLDDIPEIPVPFHEALVYWCQWHIALRERQEIHATNYRRLLENELLSVRDEYDNDFDRSKNNGFKIRRS